MKNTHILRELDRLIERAEMVTKRLVDSVAREVQARLVSEYMQWVAP